MAHSHPAYTTAREEVAAKLRWVTPDFRVTALMEQLADESVRAAQLWAVVDNRDFHLHYLTLHATADDARAEIEGRLIADRRDVPDSLAWVVPDAGGFAVLVVNGKVCDDYVIRPVKVGEAMPSE
jgi:hypothetical protein